jgi:hypothetical protein
MKRKEDMSDFFLQEREKKEETKPLSMTNYSPTIITRCTKKKKKRHCF